MFTRASGQRSTRRQSNCGSDCVGRNAKNALDAEETEAAPALYWMWKITIKGVAVIAKFNNESCVSLCVVWKLYLKPIFVVVVGQNSHCLQWNCCLCPEACFTFFYEKCISMFPMSGLAARSFDSLQSFADRFFWFCSQTAQWGFFEAMPTPDAVWKSRWHQRGFFFLGFLPAGLGSVQHSVSHFEIARPTETEECARSDCCSCQGSNQHQTACSGKSQSCCLRWACICVCPCTSEKLCYRYHCWTSKQLLFICDDKDPDGPAKKALLWQHRAFCFQGLVLRSGREKTQDYCGFVNKRELFLKILQMCRKVFQSHSTHLKPMMVNSVVSYL